MNNAGKLYLIKYAEIAIKGKNRHLFEEKLVDNIQNALSDLPVSFSITRPKGRIYVEPLEACDEEDVLERLTKVFGITAISPAVVLPDKDFETLKTCVIDYINKTHPGISGTFKVNARRSDKGYPLDSMEINASLGECILDSFPALSVDVHKPNLLITVEVRERIFIYSKDVPGQGGMPVGTSQKATLLLSGGIDSPVAGFLMAKRGAMINAVYFHAPPYTSERAKQKVVDLAKIIAGYAGSIRLYVVNFTDIQMCIYDNAPHDELTIIMRRYMMKIAESFAEKEGSLALITGESLGQVASQTMESIHVTDEAANMPVFRPLIGLDKQEIIDIAERIDTYETSILPYEDCCTIFVAKHPVTKPRLNVIQKSEARLHDKIDVLVEQAVSTAECIEVG